MNHKQSQHNSRSTTQERILKMAEDSIQQLNKQLITNNSSSIKHQQQVHNQPVCGQVPPSARNQKKKEQITIQAFNKLITMVDPTLAKHLEHLKSHFQNNNNKSSSRLELDLKELKQAKGVEAGSSLVSSSANEVISSQSTCRTSSNFYSQPQPQQPQQ